MANALVISPHPDDEAIGCGGKVRSHVVAGDRVKIIFLTSGELGGHGRPTNTTLQVREEEALKAASILGVVDTEFWRLRDGALKSTRKLQDRIARSIEAFCPVRIYAPHPGEAHPDHRAAFRAVAGALRRLNCPSPAFLTYEVWTPLPRMTEVVDITEHLAWKMKAIRAYRSQCRVLDFAAAMRGLARYRGEMHCWPVGDYAEVFLEMHL